MESVEYIDSDYNVWDGGHVAHNCTDINHAQWSYNNAILLQGSAFMWDYVSAGLSSRLFFFFNIKLMASTTDERPHLGNPGQRPPREPDQRLLPRRRRHRNLLREA